MKLLKKPWWIEIGAAMILIPAVIVINDDWVAYIFLWVFLPLAAGLSIYTFIYLLKKDSDNLAISMMFIVFNILMISFVIYGMSHALDNFMKLS